MSKQDETVNVESMVGQRLSKVQKLGGMFLVFHDNHVPIASRITIGRGAGNVVELDDALVSRYHALVQKIGDEYFIEDMQSTNGTFVNGQKVPPRKYMRVSPGDHILIGRTQLSLRHLGV